MTIKVFNSLDEIQKYYDKETNTYVFKDYDSVVFSFDLNINSNIKCKSIKGIIEGAKHFVLDKKIGVLGNE